MGAQAIGLAAALVAGAAVYLFSLRFMDTVWAALSRRALGDAEYIFRKLDLMFKETTLRRCQQVVWGSGLFGLVLGVLVTWHLNWLFLILFSLIIAYLCLRIPRRVVDFMHERYLGRFQDQFVDALVMMSSALRSGLSLVQAMDLVVKEMPAPTSQEFGLTLRQHNLGQSLDEALEAMAERVPSDDLGLFVNSVVVLRETGGNLAETFDTIVFTVSERDKVRGKIKTLTAQGTAQGVILICMPFVMAVVLQILNPDYMRPMFTTVLGWIMLGFMVMLLALGGMMIRKIVNIDV